MKLTGIRKIGRFINKDTGAEYNVHKGRRVGRSTDHYFYYHRSRRVFISDRDFHHGHEPVVPKHKVNPRSQFGYTIPAVVDKYSRRSKAWLREDIREKLAAKQESLSKADLIYLCALLDCVKP